MHIEKNVVHRDIKPKNIFLDGKHEPIVGDFGLCFLLDDENGDDERGHRNHGGRRAQMVRRSGVARRPPRRCHTRRRCVIRWAKFCIRCFLEASPFDREDHRSERNRLGKGFADRREYELCTSCWTK